MAKKEQELKDKMHKYFSNYFEVYEEVVSIDLKSRIDFVLKDVNGYCFGIEVKDIQEQLPSDFTKHIKQCIRYSKKDFKTFGKIPIMMYPSISDCSIDILSKSKLQRPENNYHSKWNSALWCLCNNIGEVRKVKYGGKYGIIFIFNNQIVYDLRDYGFGIKGINEKNYYKLFHPLTH